MTATESGAQAHETPRLDAGLLIAIGSLVSDGIIVTGADTESTGPTITYVNDAVVRMSGFDRSELVGSSPRIFQSDRTDRAALRRIGSALRAGERVREELVNRTKQGADLVIELDITPTLSAHGTVTGVVAIQRDITASRAKDRRFRALVEHSSELISVSALNGEVTYISPSLEQLLGWRPEEIVGHYGAEFVHPDDLVAVSDGLTTKAATPGTYPAVEFRFRHADGSWRWLEAATTNMLDDPAVNGMVVNARDITQRKLLHEELMQALKTETLGRVAAGVAHEFNNLLTVINGYAELVSVDIADDFHGEIAAIAAAGNRAKALTSQLLAFSRRHPRQATLVNVNAVVVETLSMLDNLLSDDVQVVRDLELQTCWVLAEPDELGQVIMNLALNACDAMAGRGILTITTRLVAAGDNDETGCEGVRLEITDTGGGINPEDQARMFDPFFSTKPSGNGTGLGLAFVASTIARTNGRISVRSGVGAGSTFSIWLPVATPDAASAAPAGSTASVVRRHHRVLVVDDDAFVATLAVAMLERLGWSATVAPTSRSEIDVTEVDVALVDVRMPGLDGVDLAAHLRRQRPGLRVLFMTADIDEPDTQTQPGNSDPMLRKPFTLAQLQARMELAIDERESR